MNLLASASTMDVWYSRIDVAAVSPTSMPQPARPAPKPTSTWPSTAKIVTKARTRDSLQALDKLTEVVDGRRRIVSDPPLIVPIEELFSSSVSDALFDELHELLRKYRHSLQTDRRHLVEEFEVSRSPARSWVWVASALAHGSCCCRDGTTTTSSSSRPRRRKPRCWKRSWGGVATPLTAPGWWPAST